MVMGNAINSYVVYFENDEGTTPNNYNLGAAYPNPFNPITTIDYSIKESGLTNIVVYNLHGQVVAELVNEYKDFGNYEVQWNASNVSSGVYFIHMSINGFTSNQKVMLIK